MNPSNAPSLSIPTFDIEALERSLLARHESAKESVTQPGRFIGVSLGHWLERVQAAGVPHISASQVAEVPREAFMQAVDGLGLESPPWPQLAAAKESAVAAGDMLRWDPCAGIELKSVMAKGLSNEVIARSHLSPFDPRAADIMLEYPSDSIPVWRRPWVQALQVDGYPVEFRVFVRNGSIQGIASYYPQRPLPCTEEMLGYVEGCRQAATNIMAHLASSRETPWMPSYDSRYDATLPSATLDFLVSQAGEVLFLEAGPPLGAGAHPCAFLGREDVSGVALALAPGTQLR